MGTVSIASPKQNGDSAVILRFVAMSFSTPKPGFYLYWKDLFQNIFVEKFFKIKCIWQVH